MKEHYPHACIFSHHDMWGCSEGADGRVLCALTVRNDRNQLLFIKSRESEQVYGS